MAGSHTYIGPYLIENRKLFLKFIRDTEFAISPVSEAKIVSLAFSGVDYFEIGNEMIRQMDNQIEVIGFKNPDDRDIDWLLDQDQSKEEDHIVFVFSNDGHLRIHSDEANCCAVYE